MEKEIKKLTWPKDIKWDKKSVPTIIKREHLEFEVPVKKYPRKVRYPIYAVVLILIGLLMNGLLMAVNNFFSVNELIFEPIIQVEFNVPVKIQKREIKVIEKLVKAEPTPQAGVGLVKPILAKETNASKLVDFIYWRESHRDDMKMSGLHKTCIEKGMWNGYGYQPTKDFCFKDKATGEAFMAKEIADRLAVNDKLEVLCVYNLGPLRVDGKRIPYLNCKYYQDYLQFIK
jgi:hypothetical protein